MDDIATTSSGYRVEDVAASEAYWKLQLRAVEGPTRLASALPSEAGGEGYGEHAEVLEAALTERLEHFAQQERVTLNTLVQAAWALLLNRYTGQPCVTFGATSAGRPAELPGVESLVGLFINTFPVICQVEAAERIGEWLRQLQGRTWPRVSMSTRRCMRSSAGRARVVRDCSIACWCLRTIRWMSGCAKARLRRLRFSECIGTSARIIR